MTEDELLERVFEVRAWARARIRAAETHLERKPETGARELEFAREAQAEMRALSTVLRMLEEPQPTKGP